MGILHLLLIACACAAIALCFFAARSPTRFPGPVLMVTAMVALLDWVLLLVRDGRSAPAGAGWVTFFDAFIIIGIAWIPCYLLLRLFPQKLRVPAYTLGAAAALWWIIDHTPAHAVFPHAGAATSALTVTFCILGFAALNWAVALHPKLGRAAALSGTETAYMWLATGIVVAVAAAYFGSVVATGGR